MITPALCTVGVFDSGVGGLSVLKALHEAMPGTRFVYVADSAYAPYGERTDEEVADRTLRIAAHLLAEGAWMLVVACNTATAVAVAAVRARWPDVPVVGVEPGLKPAIAASRNRHVGVMATPMTLRSNKFQKLLETHGQGALVHLQACPGLAGAIEADAPEADLLALVRTNCQPLVDFGADTVVLGCTHYPFVQTLIQDALGRHVTLIDTAQAVARQAVRLCSDGPATSSDKANPMVQLYTTGKAETLKRLASRWLPFDCEANDLPGL